LEKFGTLYEALLQMGITNAKVLEGIIYLVFDKAVTEPHFGTMYATLCSQLAHHEFVFPIEEGSQPVRFYE
jgi:translation initiation factor 4G